jgi:integrase/recombinase XerD
VKIPFHSRWAHEISKFLAFRRVYLTTAWPAAQLRRFDSFAASHPRLSLRQAVTAWISTDPDRHPLTRSNDLTAVRQFCLYRRRFEPEGFVPEQMLPVNAVRRHFRASILTTQQIRLLLHSIPDLEGPPLRRARMRALFLVLYCTGLRLGEALRLRLADVDLKQACFRIAPSKGRSRLVPFGRDLVKELDSWLGARRDSGFSLSPETPLFEREDGRPDNLWNAGMRLNTLFRRCGLKPPRGSGRVGLRVHDLRHTFAVHRLQRWYREGQDPTPLLPWLSAYLGHVNLLGTERYLRATPEILRESSRRMRRGIGFNPSEP